MLTDAALRNLNPKSKIYKASDRDGMYVTVSPSGTITFRYDYRLHGRRETLTLGRFGPGGISPSRAARARTLAACGRLRPLTACAAPCRRRCRAIPPEQPEHEDVARIQFAGCLVDGAGRTRP